MSSSEFANFVKKADSLVTAGKLDQAVGVYLQALEIEPHNTGVRLNIVKLYLKLREFSEAVSHYIQLADTFNKEGKIEEAKNIYQELIALAKTGAPKSTIIDRRTLSANLPHIQAAIKNQLPQIQYWLASLYFDNGAVEEAINLLVNSLMDYPDEVNLHSLLGRIYIDKEMFKEAQGEFQEVIRIAPSSSGFAYEAIGDIFQQSGKEASDILVWYRNAALVYCKGGQEEEALRIYESILNLDPENIETIEKLAKVYFEIGNVAQGIATLETLADIYIKQESLDKVVGIYEKILEHSPGNAEIRDKAINMYNKVLKADPHNLTARHKLIQILLSQGKSGEVVPEFLALAQAYLEKNMLEEGFEVSRKLLDINPDEAKAHEILAKLYYRKDDKKLALEEFIKASNLYRAAGLLSELKHLNIEMKRIFPEQKEISFQEALSLFEEGKFNESELILEEIVMGDSQHLPALRLLVKAYKELDKGDKILSVCQKILQVAPEDTAAREELIEYYLNLGRIDDGIKESTYLGDIYFEGGKLTEAENLYKNILTFFPRNVGIRQRIADLYLKKNFYERAKEEYVLLIDYYTKREEIPHAIELCKKILEISPGDINAHQKLSRLAQSSGLSELAVKEYSFLGDYFLQHNLREEARLNMEKLLVLSPEKVDYREKLLGILEKSNLFEDAKVQYKALIDSYLSLGMEEKASSIYARLVEVAPLDMEVRREVSNTYLNRDRENFALKILKDILGIYENKGDYEKCIEVNSDILLILYSQGEYQSYLDYRQRNVDWYLQISQKDNAIEEYKDIFKNALLHDMFLKAGEILPKLVEIWITKGEESMSELEALAGELHENDQNEAEILVLKSLVSLYEERNIYDKEISALKQIKQFYWLQDEFDKTHECIDKMALLFSKQGKTSEVVDVLFEKIEIYLKSSKLDNIQDVFSNILTKADEGEARYRLGGLYFTYKHFDRALPYFKEAFMSNPEDIEVLSRLSIINIRLGKLSEAVSMVKEVYSRNKDFQVIEEYIKAASVEFEEFKFKFNLGHLYREIGFYEEAVAKFVESMQDKNFFLPASRAIAEIFIKQGLPELAQEQYDSILKAKGFEEEDLMDIRYDLAKTLESRGSLKEALEHYHECYAVDIKYKDVAEKINKLSKALEEKR